MKHKSEKGVLGTSEIILILRTESSSQLNKREML